MAGGRDNLLSLDQERLDGRFKLLRPLGAGHVGVVYEALDEQRGARVALKKLRNVDPDALGRFRKEFRALQDLQHPNLITLGELFTRDGEWFLTMDLIDGVDFLEWVRPDGGALHLDRLRESLGQLARGLCVLHAAKKVHRDVKPSNIRVTPEGRPVLLDFGFVKDLGASGVRSDARIVGTIDYMAPEQAASRVIGPSADWYSVGVILYQSLTGQVPLTGAAFDVITKKQGFVPLPPSRMVRGVPEDLDALCMDLLKPEPRARPSGGAVLARLGLEDSTPIRNDPAVGPPFVGRRDEMVALRAAWDKSRTTGVTVVVHGASGVGKSELVRHFLDEISGEHPEPLVLRGRCYERESVPYKGVDDVIEALARHMRDLPSGEAASFAPAHAELLPRVFPVMSGLPGMPRVPRAAESEGDPRELRSRVFQAMRELFLRVSQRYPLVVAIEDLQWADADALALLGEVLRPPRAPSVLLLITMRESEDHKTVDLRQLSGDLRRVQLAGLPEADARLLAATLLGASQQGRGPEAARIAEEARGHPLFIQELVRHSPGAGQLEDAIWDRTRKLSIPARTILELCALASRPLAQEVAAGAAKVEPAELARHVALLRAGNLVRTSGPGPRDLIEPYHDRVRESVLARLDVATRRERHARLAMSLETLGRADAEAVWLHWREAGESAKAAQFVEIAAAQAASALAFDRAASLYRVALELAPGQSAERSILQERLAEALACAGRGPEAALAYLQVAEARGGSPSARRRAADQLLRSGHIDAGLATYGELLEAAGFPRATGRSRLLASIAWRRAWIRMRGLGFRERRSEELPPAVLERIDTAWSVSLGLSFVEPLRAFDFQTRHVLLALQAGEPMRVSRAFSLEACFCAMLGGSYMPRAVRLAAEARAIADRCGHTYALGWSLAAEATVAMISGDIRRAATLVAETEAMFRKLTGVSWELDSLRLLKQWCAYQMGEIEELRSHRRVVLPEAEAKGDLYAEVVYRTGVGSFDLLADGDPQEVRRQTEEVMKRWTRRGFHVQDFWAAVGMAHADLYEGLGAQAVERVEAMWPDLRASQQLRLSGVRTMMRDVRSRSHVCASMAVQGAEREAHLKIAEQEAKALAGETIAWPRVLALINYACVAEARGDTQRALSLFQDAERETQSHDFKLRNAAVRRRLGALVGGAQGQAIFDAGTRFMQEQQIVDPAAITAVLAPGARR